MPPTQTHLGDIERQLRNLNTQLDGAELGLALNQIGEQLDNLNGHLKALGLLQRIRMQDDLSVDKALTVGAYDRAMGEIDRILGIG